MKLKDRVMDAARNVPTNGGDKIEEKKGARSMWIMLGCEETIELSDQLNVIYMRKIRNIL